MLGRRGVSELVSVVFYVAIIIAAIGLVMQVAMPQISKLEETNSIDQSIDTLSTIDDAVRAVANEGRYSTRNINLNFQRGTYNYDESSERFFYELETDSGIISTQASRPMGPVTLSANADVSVTNTTIDGVECYMLENRRVRACIRNLSTGSTINTSETLVQLYNKDTGRELNGTLYTEINSSQASREGTGYTVLEETGNNLGRGRVTAHLSTSEGDYNVTYSLLSGADFLTVETHGDAVASSMTGLDFVMDDAGTDRVFIDGEERSPGTYNDLGYGYGTAQDGTMVGGVVASGDGANVTYATETDTYRVEAARDGNNVFLVPFTHGSYLAVEQREDLISSGVRGVNRFFGYPSPNFAYALSEEKTVRAALSYDGIRLYSPESSISPGLYTLQVRNEGVTPGGKTNVSIAVK